MYKFLSVVLLILYLKTEEEELFHPIYLARIYKEFFKIKFIFCQNGNKNAILAHFL